MGAPLRALVPVKRVDGVQEKERAVSPGWENRNNRYSIPEKRKKGLPLKMQGTVKRG